ncbi:hypothetical protein HRG_004364 [Hirsutella rhossiliensis]|uniref:Uncharacterized protein n=1 Tax=Hirsutella rhossiliensis TaxID=111463 RepID=A0A9P8SKA6_9HYPO|nr:uncharacterized protein HRG_04364 [Hirsutella rhossiliensis]KAH0963936.1 hypothetical protein HRG_04364 [Hirsutella rhossiliensis]
MCVATDVVRTICGHEDDKALAIVLCKDRACKSHSNVLKLAPGWCSSCREALQETYSETQLRRHATARRAWALVVRSKEAEMPKPMLPSKLTKIREATVKGDLQAKADQVWETKLLAKVAEYSDRQMVMGDKKWDATGKDKARQREVMEEARAMTMRWVQ